MGIDAEVSGTVRADPEIVWGLLEDAAKWPTWWRACIAASTDDGKVLREGSRLEVVLQPKLQKITFRPEVDLLTEYRTLSLTHRSLSVQATVAWYLVEKEDATQVSAQAVVNGLLPCFMSILQQRGIVARVLKGNLMGLRKAAMMYTE